MNHIDRRLLMELKDGKNVQENLPIYSTQMLHLEYEYSMILAALHYYTLGEVLLEEESLLTEDFKALAGRLQKCIEKSLITEQFDGAVHEENLKELDAIRNEIIYKMQVLTCYTDELQIYEYILNRVEAGILDMIEPVDVAELCDRLYQYVFKENDNMVINSKLQMITSQLPMRMTKAKFYDTLSQALSIYNGSEKANFDEFVERIRGVVLLDKPEGYGTEYPEICEHIRSLETMDYQKLSKAEFLDAMALIAAEAEHINQIVTDYLLMTDVVNSVYAAVLAIPYENLISDALTSSKSIIRKVYDSVLSEGVMQEDIMELLVSLEGEQEQLLEEIAGYESVFQEVKMVSSDVAEGMMEDKKLLVLEYMQQLHSNSVFIDLAKKETSHELADMQYISQVEKQFEADLDAVFAGASRLKKRAIMAGIVGQLPVIFNNTQEIQEYIRYTLTSCSNDSELVAVKKLLEDLMLE